MTPEDATYAKKERLRQVTFDGFNDLFVHPLWGTWTITAMQEREQLCRDLNAQRPSESEAKARMHRQEQSFEMMSRDERCIDEHGFSSMLD